MYKSTLSILLFLSILLSCGEKSSTELTQGSENIAERAEEETTANDEGVENVKKEIPKEIPSTKQEGFKMEVFDPDYINGRWKAEDQNGFSFGAWFDSENGIVFGQYCAMNYDASRVDCGNQEDIQTCYLRSGPINGKDLLVLELVSCYSEKSGKASISPQEDGNLVWRLIEEPGVFEVDHFAPNVALLRKVSFDPYE